MVGNNPDKTGKAKGGPRSGRTSPGLNVKRFTIPKKQKDLLNEVELDSSEYLREIQPIIQQGYRDSSSKNRFNYGKVQLVHNSAIKKEFMGKKREMKDDGRGEKELTESYAFLYVEKEETAKKLCSESVCADDITDDPRKVPRLGNPSMGVHVCRFSDIIMRNGFPSEGILVILKIIKGKVKTAPLNYSREVLEPTPNFDCHVAKSPAESDIHHFKLFDTSQIFVYDFDEEEVEFRKRPRNIYPYALVHFTYSKSGATGSPLTTPQTSSFNRKSGTSSNESTPTRKISVPETAGVAVVAPCFPRNDIVTERPKQDKDRPFAEKYAEYLDRSYRVWTGHLLNKNNNSCRVSLISFGLSFLPCQMPDTLSSLKAVRIKDLKLPSKIFTGSTPMSSRVKEVQANGKYYWYAELHSLSVDDAVYHRFLNYISDKELVLKKEIKDTILMYILPTGKTSQKLGLTTSYHPKMMHCLIESYLPMVTTLTDVSVKQPRHQHKLNLESAPVHDIDTDNGKRLRFQSSLARLFYQQNVKLREMGVQGDDQTDPATVSPLRRASTEMWEEQRDYGQEIPLPEHLAGVYQQQEWPQDNQRTREWLLEEQRGHQLVSSHTSSHHPNSHPSPHQPSPHHSEPHPSPYHHGSLHPSPHHHGLHPSPHHHGSPLPSSHGHSPYPGEHPYPTYPPVDNVSGHSRNAEYPLSDRQDDARFGTLHGHTYPRGQTRDRHSSEHSIDHLRALVQSERRFSQEQVPHRDVPRVERRVSQEPDVPHVQRRPLQQKPELKQKRGRESLESPESPPLESRYPSKDPPFRQGSNHSTDSEQSYSSSKTEQILGQELTAMSQQLEKHKSRMVLESPESPPPQDRRPGPWDRKPRSMDGNQGRNYEHQDSAKRFKQHDKDGSKSQDGKRELTPQIKEVASKVHDMLTGGINLRLPSGVDTSTLSSPGNRSSNTHPEPIAPETEDQKLERMRNTLQSLVAERERLTKRQEQPSENDSGNEVDQTPAETAQAKDPPETDTNRLKLGTTPTRTVDVGEVTSKDSLEDKQNGSSDIITKVKKPKESTDIVVRDGLGEKSKGDTDLAKEKPKETSDIGGMCDIPKENSDIRKSDNVEEKSKVISDISVNKPVPEKSGVESDIPIKETVSSKVDVLIDSRAKESVEDTRKKSDLKTKTSTDKGNLEPSGSNLPVKRDGVLSVPKVHDDDKTKGDNKSLSTTDENVVSLKVSEKSEVKRVKNDDVARAGDIQAAKRAKDEKKEALGKLTSTRGRKRLADGAEENVTKKMKLVLEKIICDPPRKTSSESVPTAKGIIVEKKDVAPSAKTWIGLKSAPKFRPGRKPESLVGDKTKKKALLDDEANKEQSSEGDVVIERITEAGFVDERIKKTGAILGSASNDSSVGGRADNPITVSKETKSATPVESKIPDKPILKDAQKVTSGKGAKEVASFLDTKAGNTGIKETKKPAAANEKNKKAAASVGSAKGLESSKKPEPVAEGTAKAKPTDSKAKNEKSVISTVEGGRKKMIDEANKSAVASVEQRVTKAVPGGEKKRTLARGAPIESASEMLMFLTPPKKRKKIRSADEMRQFLNKPLSDLPTKKSTTKPQKDWSSFAKKSPDELLKSYDDVARGDAKYLFNDHHKVTWSMKQGLRVSVTREKAGACVELPPRMKATKRVDEEEALSSCIMAVLHKSFRLVAGVEESATTKEGLAYQIRQVVHVMQKPVKKANPRKIQEVQKNKADQKQQSASAKSGKPSPAGQGVLRKPLQATGDGLTNGSTRPASKKHSEQAVHVMKKQTVRQNDTTRTENDATQIQKGSTITKTVATKRKKKLIKVQKHARKTQLEKVKTIKDETNTESDSSKIQNDVPKNRTDEVKTQCDVTKTQPAAATSQKNVIKTDESDTQPTGTKIVPGATKTKNYVTQPGATKIQKDAIKTQNNAIQPNATKTQKDATQSGATKTQKDATQPDATKTQKDAAKIRKDAIEIQKDATQPGAAKTQKDATQPDATKTQKDAATCKVRKDATEIQKDTTQPGAAKTQKDATHPGATKTQKDATQPDATKTQKDAAKIRKDATQPGAAKTRKDATLPGATKSRKVAAKIRKDAIKIKTQKDATKTQNDEAKIPKDVTATQSDVSKTSSVSSKTLQDATKAQTDISKAKSKVNSNKTRPNKTSAVKKERAAIIQSTSLQCENMRTTTQQSRPEISQEPATVPFSSIIDEKPCHKEKPYNSAFTTQSAKSLSKLLPQHPAKLTIREEKCDALDQLETEMDVAVTSVCSQSSIEAPAVKSEVLVDSALDLTIKVASVREKNGVESVPVTNVLVLGEKEASSGIVGVDKEGRDSQIRILQSKSYVPQTETKECTSLFNKETGSLCLESKPTTKEEFTHFTSTSTFIEELAYLESKLTCTEGLPYLQSNITSREVYHDDASQTDQPLADDEKRKMWADVTHSPEELSLADAIGSDHVPDRVADSTLEYGAETDEDTTIKPEVETDEDITLKYEEGTDEESTLEYPQEMDDDDENPLVIDTDSSGIDESNKDRPRNRGAFDNIGNHRERQINRDAYDSISKKPVVHQSVSAASAFKGHVDQCLLQDSAEESVPLHPKHLSADKFKVTVETPEMAVATDHLSEDNFHGNKVLASSGALASLAKGDMPIHSKVHINPFDKNNPLVSHDGSNSNQGPSKEICSHTSVNRLTSNNCDTQLEREKLALELIQFSEIAHSRQEEELRNQEKKRQPIVCRKEGITKKSNLIPLKDKVQMVVNVHDSLSGNNASLKLNKQKEPTVQPPKEVCLIDICDSEDEEPVILTKEKEPAGVFIDLCDSEKSSSDKPKEPPPQPSNEAFINLYDSEDSASLVSEEKLEPSTEPSSVKNVKQSDSQKDSESEEGALTDQGSSDYLENSDDQGQIPSPIPDAFTAHILSNLNKPGISQESKQLQDKDVEKLVTRVKVKTKPDLKAESLSESDSLSDISIERKQLQADTRDVQKLVLLKTKPDIHVKRLSAFERLEPKQSEQQKRVSVFDRLYIPKTSESQEDVISVINNHESVVSNDIKEEVLSKMGDAQKVPSVTSIQERFVLKKDNKKRVLPKSYEQDDIVWETCNLGIVVSKKDKNKRVPLKTNNQKRVVSEAANMERVVSKKDNKKSVLSNTNNKSAVVLKKPDKGGAVLKVENREIVCPKTTSQQKVSVFDRLSIRKVCKSSPLKIDQIDNKPLAKTSLEEKSSSAVLINALEPVSNESSEETSIFFPNAISRLAKINKGVKSAGDRSKAEMLQGLTGGKVTNKNAKENMSEKSMAFEKQRKATYETPQVKDMKEGGKSSSKMGDANGEVLKKKRERLTDMLTYSNRDEKHETRQYVADRYLKKKTKSKEKIYPTDKGDKDFRSKKAKLGNEPTAECHDDLRKLIPKKKQLQSVTEHNDRVFIKVKERKCSNDYAAVESSYSKDRSTKDKKRSKSCSSSLDEKHLRNRSNSTDQQHSRNRSNSTDQQHSRSRLDSTDQQHARSRSSSTDQQHSRSRSNATNKQYSRSRSNSTDQQHSKSRSDSIDQQPSRSRSNSRGSQSKSTRSRSNSGSSSRSVTPSNLDSGYQDNLPDDLPLDALFDPVRDNRNSRLIYSRKRKRDDHSENLSNSGIDMKTLGSSRQCLTADHLSIAFESQNPSNLNSSFEVIDEWDIEDSDPCDDDLPEFESIPDNLSPRSRTNSIGSRSSSRSKTPFSLGDDDPNSRDSYACSLPDDLPLNTVTQSIGPYEPKMPAESKMDSDMSLSEDDYAPRIVTNASWGDTTPTYDEPSVSCDTLSVVPSSEPFSDVQNISVLVDSGSRYPEFAQQILSPEPFFPSVQQPCPALVNVVLSEPLPTSSQQEVSQPLSLPSKPQQIVHPLPVRPQEEVPCPVPTRSEEIVPQPLPIKQQESVPHTCDISPHKSVDVVVTSDQEIVKANQDSVPQKPTERCGLKAPSSQVLSGNRFHPYDRRPKTCMGYFQSLVEPRMSELTDNMSAELFRSRRLSIAKAMAESGKKEHSSVSSPARFWTTQKATHDAAILQRAEEADPTYAETTHEGVPKDPEVSQRKGQLEVLDQQIQSLSTASSDLHQFFILDSTVYPIKNGDNSALTAQAPPPRRSRSNERHRTNFTHPTPRPHPPPQRHGPPRHHSPPQHRFQIPHHHGMRSPPMGAPRPHRRPPWQNQRPSWHERGRSWDRPHYPPPPSRYHQHKRH